MKYSFFFFLTLKNGKTILSLQPHENTRLAEFGPAGHCLQSSPSFSLSLWRSGAAFLIL